MDGNGAGQGKSGTCRERVKLPFIQKPIKKDPIRELVMMFMYYKTPISSYGFRGVWFI